MTGGRLVRGQAATAVHLPNVFSSMKEVLASDGLSKKAEGGRWARPGRERVWKPWLRLEGVIN